MEDYFHFEMIPFSGDICSFSGGRSYLWVFPKMGIPQNGWFIMEHPIKMDDLGGCTTPIFGLTPLSEYRICGRNKPHSPLMNSERLACHLHAVGEEGSATLQFGLGRGIMGT